MSAVTVCSARPCLETTALPLLGTVLNHIAKSRDQRDQAPRFSPERALSKLAIHRRDLILEAIARSAAELLRADSPMESIGTVLEQIGTATGVERVHVLAV